MRFLFELAWRDLRQSGRSLWVFCASLALGVTLISATGGLYYLVNQGLLADTRVLLGGDVEIDANGPLPDHALNWVQERGDVSLITELDTMLGTLDGDFLRVELQAMDALYPLYGELSMEPDISLAEATAFADGAWGVAIDTLLADRLDLGVGDEIYIGELTMRVNSLVLYQPDRSLNAEWRGAPVLVSEASLGPSGLVTTGSRVDYDYRVRTSIPAAEWRRELFNAFPNVNWEVRTFENRSERIGERLDQLASGLLIIAFSTLFIGGLGVFNSIQSYLQGKLKTIATIRSLGMRSRSLAFVYLLQIGILSGLSSLLGALVGGALAISAAGLVAEKIQLTGTATGVVLPMVVAILFGMMTAFAFALPAVGRALSVQPAILFRGAEARVGDAPVLWWLGALACGAVIMVSLLVALPDTLFALGFIVTVVLILLFFELIVRAIRVWARRLEDHPGLAGRFDLRLALANLYRPGTPLRATLLSLGSALTLLVACTMVVVSLLRTINETIPQDSPALVLYDVLDDQLQDVVGSIQSMQEAVRVETSPLVRTRIIDINGVPVADVPHLGLERRRDAAQEDYDLSYAANNIDDVSLVSGAWWTDPAPEMARLALEDREANRLGLKVGDQIRFGAVGKTVVVQVDAIFSQKGLQTRFWFEGILSDGALEGMIARHVGTAYLSDEGAIEAQRRIGQVAPNVITVRTASLLTTARDILGKSAMALAVVAGISLLASVLVLISVMAAGRSRQVYDATVLHSLGARMGSIRRSLHLEYVLLAIITSFFALALGSMIAMPLLALRLKLSTEGLLLAGIVIAVLVSGLSLHLGARYLLRRLDVRPAVLLRSGS